MEVDRAEAVATLLVKAEEAHAVYEADALNGVYDDAWPRWYATYAVEHGLAEILGHEVGVDEMTAFLAQTYAEFTAADPKPEEPWAEATARRIVAEL